MPVASAVVVKLPALLPAAPSTPEKTVRPGLAAEPVRSMIFQVLVCCQKALVEFGNVAVPLNLTNTRELPLNTRLPAVSTRRSKLVPEPLVVLAASSQIFVPPELRF